MVSADDVSISFRGVTKDFGDVRALDDISVDFFSGQITALLGLSGSGKSTMLRHINGLQQPSTGDVRVFGSDVSMLHTRELRKLRRGIGMIFQGFNLVGASSVLENVCIGRLGSLAGPRFGLLMYPRSVRSEALDNLERVGLADRAFQRADTLSGGQQQRVAVARALMQHPRLLLADEPVASLDPVSTGEVMNLLSRIAREENLSVVCSLHQVHLAFDFADRIVGLREGRVVLDADTADLDSEAVAEVYQKVSGA